MLRLQHGVCWKAGSALDASASVTVRADRVRVSTYSLRKVGESDRWRIRKTEQERISTHLDQCQVFQIEPEEVISVKKKEEVCELMETFFSNKPEMCGCYSIPAPRPKLCTVFI